MTVTARASLGPVLVLGKGKVGTVLTRELRRQGVRTFHRAARTFAPARRLTARVVLLAVRDGAIEPLATLLARGGALHPDSVVLHCAGGIGPEVLLPLHGLCRGVGQMHPMLSFASPKRSPSMERAHVQLRGDAEAIRMGKRLATRLGMTARVLPEIDLTLYHAAAGLLANGAAALCAAATSVLSAAGMDVALAPLALGPLLRSVADNVEHLGLPAALTGPVRRGELETVAGHLAVLRRLSPALAVLYRELAKAQLPLARALGEGPPGAFDAISAMLGRED